MLALVTAAVASGSCREIDNAAFDLVQSVRAPALDLAASVVTVFGQTGITIVVALGIAVVRFRAYPRAALIPLFIFVVIAVEIGLKLLVPDAPPPHERSRSVDLVPFVKSPLVNSFPSGHVARFAFLLRIADPVPTWALAVGIVVMVVTRLYLGEHWLSDTVGGAILGVGGANVARALR